jgi:hypothetical protein
MIRSTSTTRWLRTLAFVAVLAGQASWAAAGTLGGIAGTVTDSKTGAPVAGAHVDITSPSQSIKVTTDARGHYIAFSLQPDNYTLTAEKDGYNTRSVSGFAVFADQTQQYDLQLDPGSDGS